MKIWYKSAIIALMLALSGCASTLVRSDVTVFQEWPADIGEKTYVFEPTAAQANDLEYRNYENLVRNELQRLGFSEVTTPSATAARLKTTLTYDIRGRDVRVIEGTLSEPYWYNAPLFGHRWRGRGYYGPYYDPFWPAPQLATEYVENTYQIHTRRLKIAIAQQPSGKKLFDVTVVSEGTEATLAAVMPYMVRSAFTDFPGTSGVPRRIDLKMQRAMP